jgi:predicted MPP superfamily phosphohydrolase
MVRIFFFIIFVSAVILLLGGVQLLLLRILIPPWWKKRWIRLAFYLLPVAGVVFIVVFGLAEYHRIGWLGAVAGPLTVITVVLEISLMLSLPISGAFHILERVTDWLSRKSSRVHEHVPDPKRRLVLRGAAALVPVAAVAAGAGGVGRAYGQADVRLLDFEYSDLPDDLDGLRILHLSDLHLHHYITLSDLEATLTEASGHTPDLVLVTGDVADDLNQLGDALAMIAQLRPRLGVYATLGNHEYFRGINQVKAIYTNSAVRLLIDESVTLPAGNHALRVAGIDDPRSMHDIPEGFFSAAIAKAFVDSPERDFTLLMSHRPDAFPYAAAQGVDLTLAGHTHGAQIGFGGRSLLENAFPHSYLWGKYTRGASHLYTSCGMGHWFPFRLGCPAEAPVVVLKSV